MGKTSHFNRALGALAAGLLAAAPSLATQYDADAALDAVRDRVEVAVRAGDLPALEAARAEFLDRSAAGPASRAAYFAAYVRFRQGQLADAGAARGYLDDCIRELGAYVERAPADAEARALLASCYGVSTRYNRLALASRGLEARRHMNAARELAPQNPWVVMQDAMADFATPRLFGGDRKLAIAKLERATGLFAAAVAAGSRIAAWGAAEAWLQLGEMYRAAGRDADARLALERAASLAPRRDTRLASL
jgi:DNA-binding SARP family transcriptional activator